MSLILLRVIIMFGMFKKAFKGCVVTEDNLYITIENIDGASLIRDINKHWKTTRISANMFVEMSRYRLKFYKFFAIEFAYILDEVLNYKNKFISVRAVSEIKNALYTNTWLANTKPIDRSTVPGRLDLNKLSLFKEKYQPLQYQLDYYKDYSYRLDRFQMRGDLLAAQPGTGKTVMTLQVAECANVDTIIVVSPLIALDSVWTSSIEDMYVKPQSVWATNRKKPYNNERIIVTSYEQQSQIVDILKANKLKNNKIAIILDECHNLNEPNALRTQLFIEICKLSNSENIILGSGTPVKALGTELVTLLTVIDPMFTPEVRDAFKKMFGKEATKGLDIIRHRMGIISYKIEKTEIGLDAPIMHEYLVKIPNGDRFTLDAIKVDMEKFIAERWDYYKKRRPEDEAFWNKTLEFYEKTLRTPDQKEKYKDYLKNLNIVKNTYDIQYLGDIVKATNTYEKKDIEPALPKDWIKQFRDVKSVIKYTQLKIQGECLGRVLGNKRIECHVAMVPYIDWVSIVESTEKKTIVFTSFVEALTATEKMCRERDLEPVGVYGQNSNDLVKIINEFDSNPRIDPLIATYQSLSTAVRLTMANVMILLNSPFRSYILEQAIARIHRKGQDTQTHVYQCKLDTGDKPNISTRSADILKWSAEQVEKIMGFKAPYEVGSSFETEHFDDQLHFKEQFDTWTKSYDIDLSFEAYIPVNKQPIYLDKW